MGVNSSDSFLPMWQRLYVLSDRLPWQQLQSKEIFLSSFALSAPALLFLFCPLPCEISSSYSLPLFLFLQLVQTWFAEIWVGNVQVCVSTHKHTHTRILSVCCWCSRPGNNESQKETFLQKDLELQHCK